MDPAERDADLHIALTELKRMNRIVDELLLLAKAEQPDFIRPRRLDLPDLTSELISRMRALGPRRWRLAATGEGQAVLDDQRVAQAVLQLTDNALRQTRLHDEIRLGTALRDGRVSIWVSDSGDGIDPADHERIFERFGRGRPAADPTVRQGAGLGLAIVRTIAEAHGGTVWVRSTTGHGATFTLELPTGNLDGAQHPRANRPGS